MFSPQFSSKYDCSISRAFSTNTTQANSLSNTLIEDLSTESILRRKKFVKLDKKKVNQKKEFLDMYNEMKPNDGCDPKKIKKKVNFLPTVSVVLIESYKEYNLTPDEEFNIQLYDKPESSNIKYCMCKACCIF